MLYFSQNPVTGETMQPFPDWDAHRLHLSLKMADAAQLLWRLTLFDRRTAILRQTAAQLRQGVAEYAALITLEMDMPILEARAEVEKYELKELKGHPFFFDSIQVKKLSGCPFVTPTFGFLFFT